MSNILLLKNKIKAVIICFHAIKSCILVSYLFCTCSHYVLLKEINTFCKIARYCTKYYMYSVNVCMLCNGESAYALLRLYIFFHDFLFVILPSSKQPKCWHCRNSLSLMKPVSGVAQPSDRTCTHWVSTYNTTSTHVTQRSLNNSAINYLKL